MKVNELRIGNWVSTISDEPELLKIEGIKLYDLDTDDDCVRLESFDTWTAIDCIAPIPLTTEWLERFGFEKINASGIRYYNNGKINITLDFSINYDAGQRTHIQYVHQLQTLYFALTGEELIQ